MADVADRKVKVFISYSRRDLEFASRLVSALEARGITAKIDTRDLPKLEDWRRELIGFIREADAVIFIVSPHSVGSPVCSWEVEQVASLNKRLAPIVLECVSDDRIPEAISKVNYVFFDRSENFESQVDILANALQTDREWIKNHTRLGERAHDWEQRGRTNAELFRGQEIDEAEKWLASRPRAAPEPTTLQKDFIARSRRAATNRLRYGVAASLLVAAVAVGLAVFALVQRNAAETSRNNAVRVLATSDFQRGTTALQSDDTTAEGLALLARAVRIGHDQRAVTRLWTVLQQRDFWLPAADKQLPNSPPRAGLDANSNDSTDDIGPGVSDSIKKRFGSFTIKGEDIGTKFISMSGDGKTLVTVVGESGDNNIQYRVWRVDKTSVTDWITPEYRGSQYVHEVRAYLSYDGHFLAVEVRGWRETSTLQLFDLKTKKRIGDDIVASGAVPLQQGQDYSLVRFLQRPQSTEPGHEFVWLLTASTKGDVTLYRVEPDDVEQIARNQHTDQIFFADVDTNFDWLMSSSADGVVRVSSALQRGNAVGNIIKLSGGATAISRSGSDGLAIGLGTGVQFGFSLRPHMRMPLTNVGDIDTRPSTCTRWDGDNPVGAYDVDELQTSLGKVTRIGKSQLTVGDEGQKIYASPIFASEIVVACLNAKGDRLTISTKDFGTETWSLDFSRRFGLPIVERQLFGNGSRPTTTATTFSTQASKAAVIESYLWDPPNVAYMWYSLWDLESALPLMDRAQFGNDSSDDEVESVRMSSSGQFLVFVGTDSSKKTVAIDALQVDPPASVTSWIADLAESIGGVSINDAGAFVPVEGRLSVLARLTPELDKLTRQADQGHR